jgi:hypothetical protein
MVAVFCDLDSAIFGDLSLIFDGRNSTDICIIQSKALPACAITRLLALLTGGRFHTRGNSSIVGFHPKHHHDIAETFLSTFAVEGFSRKYLTADDRYISWHSQKFLRFINRRLAVKFSREFMGRSLGEVRARAALWSTQERRERLVFLTFNQEMLKPHMFLTFAEGQKIEDGKKRVTEWSTAALGGHKDKILKYFA